MSKTIRRKDDKNQIGYYDHLDKERNRNGAGNAYYHSDMPSRRGRWHGWKKPVKHYSDRGRRAEDRQIAHKVKVAEDIETVNIHADDKSSKEDPWGWD